MSRIDEWTRQLLEAEARKRGIRDPEVRSRSELLWAIAQHDYGARQSLRNARKLVGSLIAGAAQAFPRLSRREPPKQPATLPGVDPRDVEDAEVLDSWHEADAQLAASRAPRDGAGPSAALQPTAAARLGERGVNAASAEFRAARDDSAAGAPGAVASNGAANVELPLAAAGRNSSLQLRRADGQLELSWQVSELDAQRARTLLGQRGELSLRIVCVQADAVQVVRSSVTEHGPLDASGAWSWVLPGPDAHCVGSIGVRAGDRFVSIAHESSRVPLHPVG